MPHLHELTFTCPQFVQAVLGLDSIVQGGWQSRQSSKLFFNRCLVCFQQQCSALCSQVQHNVEKYVSALSAMSSWASMPAQAHSRGTLAAKSSLEQKVSAMESTCTALNEKLRAMRDRRVACKHA
eukprot:6188422-Pleurochrysis_carterae.AAC.3